MPGTTVAETEIKAKERGEWILGRRGCNGGGLSGQDGAEVIFFIYNPAVATPEDFEKECLGGGRPRKLEEGEVLGVPLIVEARPSIYEHCFRGFRGACSGYEVGGERM